MTTNDRFNLIVTLCRHAQMENRLEVRLRAFSRIRQIAADALAEELGHEVGDEEPAERRVA